jgi:hypothetical protein
LLEATGRWQGASPYESTTSQFSLVASIGGRIYRTTVSDFTTTELTTTDTNSPVNDQSYFVQAEEFLVIQNGEDPAFVYDGGVLYRSKGQGIVGAATAGIPIGKQMAYNNGRLWVAMPDGRGFQGGDLAYAGATGTTADLLHFTENAYLAGGGTFVVPFQAGRITAMANVALQDSTTGQGPLQVFTTLGAFSVNAPFDRTQWQTTTSPIQTVSLLAAGASSQLATVNVNGDIWFRAPDGVRSYIIARRDHGTWVNTPLSHEMERAFNFDTRELLTYGSATLFDNRFLVTTQPSIAQADGAVLGIVHAGLGVLDFTPTSSMFARSQPVWDGVWTGLRVLQVLTTGTVNTRCFLYALNADNDIELWELSRNDKFDSTDNPIEWVIETPSYGFDTGGWNLRELQYGDIWYDQVRGTFDVQALYKPDAYPLWLDWHAWQDCVTSKDCDIEECGTPTTYHEGYRSRTRLPEPANGCEEQQGTSPRQAYRFAVRLELTGPARIRQLRLIANDLPEDVVGSCPASECNASIAYSGCAPSDYTYATAL